MFGNDQIYGMGILKFGYWLYRSARSGARAVGIARPLQATLGPSVARFVFKRSTGTGQATSVNGHRMVLAEEGQFPPFAMAMDKYEVGTTNLLEQIIEPGMVVIDVGAHVGYFTLLAARRVGPEGKVYSFEPEPANYRLLQQNIESNGYRNIVATQKAVSKVEGSAQLILSSQDNGTHSLFGHGRSDAEKISVSVVSLDGFLTDEGLPHVDLVKMDVEGAEMDALGGMGRLLQRSPELKLVMEFNPTLLRNASVDPLEFLTTPGEFGFKVLMIGEIEGTVPLDQSDARSLTEALLKSKGSVNLYCLKQ